HERAVIIGSDCPQLQASIVEEAFARLEEFPVVLGPAQDGGYYLLGLHRPEPSLFHDISWSTESVLEQTLQRVAALGQEAFLLPRLSDIDRAADWERYGWELG
ncbi:MAG: glycosyltransferase, partial [Saprospiraceae bacterium]|nr:glycosyltransferase [Saprospiraceae bacterium]